MADDNGWLLVTSAWTWQTLAGPALLCLSLMPELERARFAGFSAAELISVCDVNQTQRIMQQLTETMC